LIHDSAVMTLLWLLQIVLWTNLKFYPFINFMFVAMDGIWYHFSFLVAHLFVVRFHSSS